MPIEHKRGDIFQFGERVIGHGDRARLTLLWLKADTEKYECCIDWPHATSSGYGLMTIQRKNYRVHSLICEIFHGPRPSPSHHAAHICGRRICVNHRHIRWATPAENELDKVAHGTSNRGINNGQSRWLDTDIAQCFTLRSQGLTHAAITATIGMSQGYVTDVLNGKARAHAN